MQQQEIYVNEKQGTIRNIKCKDWNKISLFLLFFVINIIPIFFMYYPVLSDEIGTIAAIESVFGDDWSVYIENTSLAYYKHGVLLIYFIPYAICKSPILLYRGMLIVNAILVSFMPVITYSILKKFLNSTNKKKNMLISICVNSMPGFLLWSKFVWAETALYLLTWLSFYLLFLCGNAEIKRKKRWWSIVLAMTSVIAYAFHVRGIVITIAVFLTVFIVRLLYKKWIVNIYAYVITLSYLFSLDVVCSRLFKTLLWQNKITNNTTNGLLDVYREKIFSLEGVNTICRTTIGWLFNFIASSYGIALLGLGISCCILFRTIKNRVRRPNIESVMLWFPVLLFLGCFAMGEIYFVQGTYELFYGNGERADKLIYGRYIAGACGPLMLICLYHWWVKEEKILKSLQIILTSIVIGVFGITMFFFSDYFEKMDIAEIQLYSVPLFLQSSGRVTGRFENFNKHLFLCCVIVFGIILFMNTLKKNRKQLINLVVLLFGITYLYYIIYSLIPIQQFYRNNIVKTESFIETIKEYDIDICLVPKIDRGWYAFQYVFDAYNVSHKDLETEAAIFVFDDEKDIKIKSEKGYFVVKEDLYSGIVIRGEVLKKRLEEKGILLEEY